MIKFAQLISAIFALILGSAGITTMLSPMSINEAADFIAISDYGITNLRTLGAPTLALAVITVIGLIRKDWLLILPASMYFLFNGSARVISLFAEQYDPIMIRGLILTFSLFIFSQIVIYIFKKAKPEQKLKIQN